MHNRPSSWLTPKLGAAIITIGVLLALVNIVQTWPHNALGYALGVSHPVTSQTHVSIQAHLVMGGPETNSMLGRPSLSPAFINRVLAMAHSPAQGTGQHLYDLSAAYGIDDVYALAFFKHESQYGTTGVARVTRSLGNIRCSAGYACIEGYRAYPSWQAGYADWYQLIFNLYIKQWHLTTVEQVVPVYAPTSDNNDVPGYIAAVEQAVAMWRAGEVHA